MFLALFDKNLIFDYLTLKLTFFPLKINLNHQNNNKNGYFSQHYKKKWYYTCSHLDDFAE